MRFALSLAALIVAAGVGADVRAQEPVPTGTPAQDLSAQVGELKQMLRQMQLDHAREVAELKARIERFETAQTSPLRTPATRADAVASPGSSTDLEAELARELGGDATASSTRPAVSSGGTASAEFSLLGTFAGGFTSIRDGRNLLEHGGGHQVQGRGFNANLELAGSGAVDPYFTANANIVFQVEEAGETNVELEEAYLTSTCLPWGLQFKGGQFFSAFGRQNLLHQHAWEFVDLPVASARMFGADGLRNPGVQLSWLTPLPFYLQVIGSVQNAAGETASSFLGAPEEANEAYGGFAGRPLADRDIRSPEDLLYLSRIETSFDLTDEITLLAGVSGAFGPNSTGGGANPGGLDSTGLHHATQVWGADLFLKWKPAATERGWPFVTWQTEYFHRRADVAGLAIDADLDGINDTVAVPADNLWDQGLYTQVVWGFTPGWTLGARYDYAVGERDRFDLAESFGDVDLDGVVDFDRAYDSRRDAFRDERQRGSAAVTFYPSEFSKFRLEYHWDQAEHLHRGTDDDDDSAHSGFLLFEYSLGKHGAHKF